MNKEKLKLEAARAALEYLPKNEIIGVGSGTTVNLFISELAKYKDSILGAVASSITTEKLLQEQKIKVVELEKVDSISVYIDGADECDANLNLIKGGGGALTREKIVSVCAKKFVCIIDSSKMVDRLGSFPLPIEVIPMSVNYVKSELENRFAAKAKLRKDFITDNGNFILDVSNVIIKDLEKLECELNNIVGVVSNGLFVNRKADIALISSNNGIKVLKS